MKKIIIYKFAFTLAEVLITLGIIGVVAAMTIPTLMKNTQDTELKTAWKKEYSVLSQAFLEIATDNGGDLTGAFDNGDGTFASNDRDTLRDKFLEKIKIPAKTCNANVVLTGFPDGCFIQALI